MNITVQENMVILGCQTSNFTNLLVKKAVREK